MDIGIGPWDDRERIGWWAFMLVLAGAALFIAYSFVGILVLGVFGYYATRPIHRQIEPASDSEGIVAWATIIVVLLPIILLLFYAGFQVFQQVQQLLGGTTNLPLLERTFGILPDAQRDTLMSIIQNPQQFFTNPQQTLQTVLQLSLRVFAAIAGTLLLLALAITLSYYLLKNDDSFEDGLCELFGGRDTTAYAYARAVDEDLEAVFFGNLVFVVVMAVIAAAAYWGTNALAPQGLQIPMVLVLAVLTGAASLIPIVVGKVVYLPVVGYLTLQAIRTSGNQFAFVAGALVVYFLLLDILPQTFLQPYITGQHLDLELMLFAYVLGPLLFGWYGFFLMPIILVLMLEAIRIVLPELVHGETLTPTASMGESIGADTRSLRADAPDDAEVGDDSAARSE